MEQEGRIFEECSKRTHIGFSDYKTNWKALKKNP
jgi:hypothetical protein